MNKIIEVPIDLIDPNPYQYRSGYDALKIKALVESIQEYGLKQPPTARRIDGRYELAFGHQRLEAFRILKTKNGYQTMPLSVEEDLTDQKMFELFVIENMQREDLSAIDKATVLKRYMDEFDATSVQAARLFGISSSYVRGLIRLLNAPNDVQRRLREKTISQGEARVILSRKRNVTGIRHTYHKPEIGNGNNLKIRLVKLIYGKYVPDVSDDTIYTEVKKMFDFVHNSKPGMEERL